MHLWRMHFDGGWAGVDNDMKQMGACMCVWVLCVRPYLGSVRVKYSRILWECFVLEINTHRDTLRCSGVRYGNHYKYQLTPQLQLQFHGGCKWYMIHGGVSR